MTATQQVQKLKVIEQIPKNLDRNGARKIFSDAGLTYGDVTIEKLQRLRNIINAKMVTSGLMEDSYMCKQRPFLRSRGKRWWAGIRCRSFYFNDRETVTFNPDGFIGFAGWADDKHIKPILEGFVEWVLEMQSIQPEDAADGR